MKLTGEEVLMMHGRKIARMRTKNGRTKTKSNGGKPKKMGNMDVSGYMDRDKGSRKRERLYKTVEVNMILQNTTLGQGSFEEEEKKFIGKQKVTKLPRKKSGKSGEEVDVEKHRPGKIA